VSEQVEPAPDSFLLRWTIGKAAINAIGMALPRTDKTCIEANQQ